MNSPNCNNDIWACYPTIIVYLQTSTQTQIKLQNYNNSNNNIDNKKKKNAAVCLFKSSVEFNKY